MRRCLFNLATVVLVVAFLALVSFFLGKGIGSDENGNPNGLYWFGRRADWLWWLSAGRVPTINVDLELFLMLMSLVVPVAWLIDRFSLRWSRGYALCQACGYDLRATPERCPECGALASPSKPPSARGFGTPLA